LIAITFWLLAAYVTIDATITLATGDHPASSPVGIGLAIVTLIAMPLLANAKASVARQLDSSAGHSESRQNLLCAYLSAALLVGLTLNAAFGWWWADPTTALIIAAVAAREGRESWRGENCCTTDNCCT
ncbi:MAG: cation transporter, partial [Solirubrobacteraceae bacterium]